MPSSLMCLSAHAFGIRQSTTHRDGSERRRSRDPVRKNVTASEGRRVRLSFELRETSSPAGLPPSRFWACSCTGSRLRRHSLPPHCVPLSTDSGIMRPGRTGVR